MKKQFKFYLFLAFIATVLTAPSFTFANIGVPITVGFFTINTFWIAIFINILILLAAVILVETIVLKIILKLSFRKALICSFLVNTVSTIVGIIYLAASSFLPYIMVRLLPRLHLFSTSLGITMSYIIMPILYLVAFLLSVYIEYFILLKILSRNFDKKLIKRGAWIANLISYLVLIVLTLWLALGI